MLKQKKDSFEKILETSERKSNLIETDDGSEFVIKIFTNLLNKNNIKIYSRYTSLGAVYAERIQRTTREFLEKPVFQSGSVNWVDILATIKIQYKNKVCY